jgi:hypothetical protein
MLTVAALATALGVSAWPPERELRDGPAGARCKSRRLLAHPRSADAGRLRERRLQLPPPFLGSLCSEERLGMTEPGVKAEVHVVRAVDDVLPRGRIRTPSTSIRSPVASFEVEEGRVVSRSWPPGARHAF